MEFDKTRVYTAVNAEELPIGSKCIFADDLDSLRNKIQDVEKHISTLTAIELDCEMYRFDNHNDAHALAYLIEPPKEKKYKPFSSVEKAREIIDKHGGWVKSKNGDVCLIICYSFDNVLVAGKHIVFYDELLQYFVFADDGSPCGELVEE